MEIAASTDNGVTTLKVAGEIDLHASPRLRAELQKIASGGNPPLLIDFREVSYIDSSGLATLIEYMRSPDGKPRKMAIFGLRDQVRMVFELVRLNELFTLCGSEEEARRSLGEP